MRRASALLLIGAGLLAGCASPRRSGPRGGGPSGVLEAVYPPGDVPRLVSPTLPVPTPSPPDPGARAAGFTTEDESAFPHDSGAAPPEARPPAATLGAPEDAEDDARDGSRPKSGPRTSRREDPPPEKERADGDDEGRPKSRKRARDRSRSEEKIAASNRPHPRDGAGPGAMGEVGEEEEDTDLDRPRAQRRGEGGGPTRSGEREEEREEEEDEELGYVPPNLLNKLLGLTDSRLKTYGWVEGSFTGNPANPPGHQNFGLDPNNLANRPALQQLYVILERRLKQGDEVDLGFRFDSLIGNDWQNFHDVGLFDNVFKPDQVGYDPVQFYADLHLPILGGIDIKGGRFYALAGYEDAMAPSRPLLSTSDMFAFGSHPFTHFGMMTTWHVTDRINVYNGAVNGWNRWINQHYIWNYAGGVSWDSKDERTNLTITLNYGPNQFPHFLPAGRQLDVSGTSPPGFLAGRVNPAYGLSDTTLFTTVLIHEWNEDFTTILETDEAIATNIPGIGPGGSTRNASWYGVGGWLLWYFADKWTGVFRGEVFRDNNGVLIRDADTFYETTLGLVYKPKPYFWVRPEVRYDWARKTQPYDDGNSGHQFTIGFDVIFLF